MLFEYVLRCSLSSYGFHNWPGRVVVVLAHARHRYLLIFNSTLVFFVDISFSRMNSNGKCSVESRIESKLPIDSISSSRFHSRNGDIFEKSLTV